MNAVTDEVLLQTPDVDDTPAAEAIEQDVEPASWLENDDSTMTGTVVTSVGKLRIAAISDEELDKIMFLSKKMDLKTKQARVDPLTVRRRIIAYSINKAYGYENPPGHVHNPAKAISHTHPMLLRKRVGELTSVQKAIMKLSGMDEETQEAIKPEDFLG